MTYHQFNSSVNMPELCRILGIKGLQYVKLPKLGWFGYNENMTHVVDIFQLFDKTSLPKVYEQIVLEHKSAHECPLVYDDQDCRNIYAQLVYKMYTMKAYKELLKNMVGPIRYPPISKKFRPRDYFIDKGYKNIDLLNATVVTQADALKYERLKWPTFEEPVIMIPSYAAPGYPCSFELYRLNFAHYYTISTNMDKEKGWFGELKNRIAESPEDVALSGGCTWDYKCNHWARQPLTLSEKLTTRDYLRIWVQGPGCVFNPTPLDYIKDVHVAEIKDNLHLLNKEQVQHIEKKFNLTLMEKWHDVQLEDCYIDRLHFIQHRNRYTVEHPDGYIENFTNFIVKIDRILRNGTNYYRTGHIMHDSQAYEFIFPEDAFSDSKELCETLKTFFLQSGIGIPVMLKQYKSYMADLVNIFNQKAQVMDVSNPVLNKTTPQL